MATKYTDLPAAAALDGSEILAVVQGGDSVQTTTQDIANLAGAGSYEPLYRSFHRETGNYVLVLGDSDEGVEMNVAGANTVTVPLNATVAFPVGTLIPVVQYGAGLTSIVATGGVTINTSAGNLDSPGQNAPMFLRKIATNEWYLWNGTAGGSGDLQDVLDAGSTATILTDFEIIQSGVYSFLLESTGISIITQSTPINLGTTSGSFVFTKNGITRFIANSHNDYSTDGGTSYHRFYNNTAAGHIRLMEAAANGSNYIGLKAPEDVTTAQTYTFPAAGPSNNGDLLASTTAGQLSWTPAVSPIGVQDLFISAAAMWPRTTGGCADLAKTEMATSLFNIQSLDFDQTTQEFCQFQIVLPRKYNNGTVTAVFYWTAAAGSGDVQWGISGGAYSNDDALTVALGTAITVDDTLIATNDLHITAATAAITLAGTPADADFLAFQISRNPASDTLSGDAKLLGVSIRITTDAATDA